MSNFAKYGLIWASGAIVGAVSTYFGVKKYFEEKYESDRREIEDFYRSKANKKTPKVEEPTDNKKDNKAESRESMIDRLNSLSKYREADYKEYFDYTSMYGGDDVTDEDPIGKEVQDMAQKASMSEHPDEETLPYIIDEDDFTNPVPAYDKITLDYYVEDDVLIDTLSHEIMDVPRTVTDANLKILMESDAEYIYVRNDQNGSDYEVVKNYEDYTQAERGYFGIV